jgi:glucokinase
MSKIYVSLDIGGTKLIVAAFDASGTLLKQERATTPLKLAAGLDLLDRLIANVTEEKPIAGIGAAAGGPLDHRTGIISPLHQPEWRNIPLKKILEAKWGCPFHVDVDTNVAALAEYDALEKRVTLLLYITLSTGVGGSLVQEGNIYRGLNGKHPEIGHQTIPYRSPGNKTIRCSCGAEGCLEELISGNGIRRVYGKSPEELNAQEWSDASWNLGQGLRNLAAIYLPDVIVLGGGISYGARDKLLEPAIRIMRDNLKIVPHPRVRVSSLGVENVLRGGFLLARKADAKAGPSIDL